MTPVQLRVARTLLGWSQDDLSGAAKVARATINRFESGKVIGEGPVRLMRYAVEEAGIILIPDGTDLDGATVFDGVGRRSPVGVGRTGGDAEAVEV